MAEKSAATWQDQIAEAALSGDGFSAEQKDQASSWESCALGEWLRFFCGAEAGRNLQFMRALEAVRDSCQYDRAALALVAVEPTEAGRMASTPEEAAWLLGVAFSGAIDRDDTDQALKLLPFVRDAAQSVAQAVA